MYHNFDYAALVADDIVAKHSNQKVLRVILVFTSFFRNIDFVDWVFVKFDIFWIIFLVETVADVYQRYKVSF